MYTSTLLKITCFQASSGRCGWKGISIAGISIARAIRVLDPIQSLDRYPLV